MYLNDNFEPTTPFLGIDIDYTPIVVVQLVNCIAYGYDMTPNRMLHACC